MDTLKLQINARHVMAGLLVTGICLYMLAHPAAISTPQTKTRPGTATETVKCIYRGVPFGHPGYFDACEGIAKPMGGTATPLQHQDGYTNSPYTSWSVDIMVAYQYATNGLYGPCNGVILIKKVDLSGNRFVDTKKMVTGDKYGEAEILVKGMMNGAIPLLVKPGLSKQEITQLLNSTII
jgi:hypothetical protein